MRLVYAVLYIQCLIWSMFKSACGTAVLALTGKINPHVMEVETDLKKPISHVVLANSITLTPGTVTVDVDHSRRVLTVAAITPRSRDDVVPFERHIRGMLE